MNVKREVVALFLMIVMAAMVIQGMNSYFFRRYDFKRLEYKLEHIAELLSDIRELDNEFAKDFCGELPKEDSYLIQILLEGKSKRATDCLDEVLVEFRTLSR